MYMSEGTFSHVDAHIDVMTYRDVTTGLIKKEYSETCVREPPLSLTLNSG